MSGKAYKVGYLYSVKIEISGGKAADYVDTIEIKIVARTKAEAKRVANSLGRASGYYYYVYDLRKISNETMAY